MITAHDRLIDIHWGAEPAELDSLWPYRLRYTDALSEAFHLEVTCLCSAPGPALETLIGRPLGLGVRTDDGARCWVSGIVEAVRSDARIGDLIPVHLSVRSALGLIARRRTSRVFQDHSVPQIVATLLDEHRRANPVLAVSFDYTTRFLLEQTDNCREYCVQYNESDAHFIQRLLAEEGIGYCFTFATPLAGAAPRHELVLFDSPHTIAASTRMLRYQPSAPMVGDEECALIGWQRRRALIADVTETCSYDYRPAQPVHGADRSPYAEAGAPAARSLNTYDALAPSQASGVAGLDRYARLRQQARERKAETFHGEGRLRGLMTGTGFLLEGHPAHEEDEQEHRDFIVTGQQWEVTNNLPHGWASDDLAARLVAGGGGQSAVGEETATYLSRFTAVRRGVPLVPDYDASLSKPTAPGPQTATVVGPPHETVYTDALGRVRIQWHWQRAQEHPTGTANLDDRSSTWVRVALPSAGNGFGHQFLPRIGQEVVVDFLEGNIDCPLVTGVVYNGRQAPAQFSGRGTLPGNRALSGIRTEEHHGSGYNELLFDDTPGQVRARLASTHQASEVNIGKLVTPRVDGHADSRGEGMEMRTEAAAVLRAAQGILLTAQAQTRSGDHQLERDTLRGLMSACGDLFRSLGEYAGGHGSQGADDEGQRCLREALAGWPDAASPERNGDPLLVIGADAGVIAATPASQLQYAGANIDQVAQQHLQLSSGKSTRVHAGQGIDLFSQGGDVKVIAHQGDVVVQSQGRDLVGNATRHVQITASEGEVLISAPCIRLVSASGSFLRLDEDITWGTQGQASAHASQHHRLGPANDNTERPRFGTEATDQRFQLRYAGHTDQEPAIAANQRYRALFEDGRVVEGTSDAQGLTDLLARDVPDLASLEWLKAGK